MSGYVKQLYGRWTQPQSAGLFGFTFGTSIIGIGMIASILLSTLFLPIVVTLGWTVLCVLVFTPMAMRRKGRTGWELMIEMWQWRKARRRGEHMFRGGRFSMIPGAGRLPGIYVQSKLYEYEAHSGHRMAIMHIKKKHHFTVVLEAQPQGEEAFDQYRIDVLVARWGEALATIGQPSDIVAVTAVIESLPETGARARAEVASTVKDDAPELAKAVMVETATTMPRSPVRTEARIAITFVADTALHKKNVQEMAASMVRRLANIMATIDRAGVQVVPMSAERLIAVMRTEWSPGDYRLLELAELGGRPHGITWDKAGPLDYVEEPTVLQHDGCRSVTWEMDAAPAGAVDERVIAALLAPNESLPRKRVAIVYRPHSSAQAVKLVDDDYKNAVVARQGERGVGTAQAALRVEATQASREEQARGAGLVRFGIMATITVPDGEDLPRAETLLKGLSEASRLQLDLCRRFQAAAFAGSQGLGIVLPEHSTVSEALAG